MKKSVLLSVTMIGALLLTAACRKDTPKSETGSVESESVSETETVSETEDEYDGIEGHDGKGDSAVTNESGLKSFRYGYDGTIGGDSYDYLVEAQEDGTVRIMYSSMEYYDLAEMSMEAGPEVLDMLYELYKKHNAARWDGYSKYDKYVEDGSGFSVNLVFNDGESMSVSGMNCAPDGYYSFDRDVEAVMGIYLQEMVEEAKQKKIEAGVPGELDYLMIYLKQQGRSGEDEYNIVIRRWDGSRESFDVHVRSVSGEYFEEGEHNYYYKLPDSEIDFAGLTEIFEKYEVYKWYGWEETSDDYGNTEWFQLNADFAEGRIIAMGSEHPEHYDEFRKELLEHVKKIVDNAREKYPDFEE